ncbi:MAG: caspase family protein [Phaeodactylibacter sp.]|nr:caspase family protein [Phaeodactylibacter sp.]
MKKNLFIFLFLLPLITSAQQPELIIPTQQVEPINGIAISSDGQYILTSYLNGVVRLWDAEGRLLQQFEPPESIGDSYWDRDLFFLPGEQAFGLLTGSQVSMWKLTGESLPSINSPGGNFTSAAVSADGQWMFTGSSEGALLRWNTKDGSRQGLFTLNSAINAISCSPAGALVFVGSGKGEAYLYDASSGAALLDLSADFFGVQDAAFSADGQYLAIAGASHDFSDPNREYPYGVASVYTLQGQAVSTFRDGMEIIDVSISPDGSYYAGTIQMGASATPGALVQTSTSTFTEIGDILASAFSPDGQAVFTAVKDADLLETWNLKGEKLRARSLERISGTNVCTSPDGRYLAIYSKDYSEATSWAYYLNTPYSHLFQLWDLQENRTISCIGEQGIDSLFFAQDGASIFTQLAEEGAGFEQWSLDGQLLQAAGSTAPPPRGQASQELSEKSGKGPFLFSGSEEGILIQDAGNGMAEVARIIMFDSTNWVVATPSGLFDASRGAFQRLHYRVGLEAVDIEQLKERYYEPGLLPKLLGRAEGALREVQGFRDVRLYPKINARIASDVLYASLEARGGGIGKVSFLINGKEVLPDANPDRKSELQISLSQYEKYYHPGIDNQLSLRAYNAEGWLKSAPVTFRYRPGYVGRRGNGDEGAPAFSFVTEKDAELYFLCVGTADYAGQALDLKYPDKDAAAMAQGMEAAGRALFGENRVHPHLLTSASGSGTTIASKANIRQAILEIAGQSKTQDVVVLYFSGHGVTYGNDETAQFYYLTKDIASENLSDPEIRNNYAISTGELTQWLNEVAALKQVLIFDACNSGKVVESLLTGEKALNSSQIRALDRMQDRTGMFVLSGSAADKVSYEASKYGQGLLTFSLLEGMSGLALRDGQYVDVMALFQYARDKVPELAQSIGGIQTPMMAFPGGGQSFDIGIVNGQVKIPLAQVKPVFVRNTFQEESAFDDVLDIGKRMQAQLQKITAKGAQASLIYVDVPEYQDAYSIKGRYKLEGNQVQLEASLFQGRKRLGAIQANGQEEQLDTLVEEILKQAFGILQKR